MLAFVKHHYLFSVSSIAGALLKSSDAMLQVESFLLKAFLPETVCDFSGYSNIPESIEYVQTYPEFSQGLVASSAFEGNVLKKEAMVELELHGQY
ncbi:hypothetical protein H671_5g14437 [Cricetulus griseus]|nr:hypothetical protein H671_5g14437 [Cricetulus griseus]